MKDRASPRIFYYKLTADNGGAPCIQDGFLSLAICKPKIRCAAEPGDLIFGFAANSLHADNRLIYVARVTGKIANGDYYRTRRYSGRSDCIYRMEGGSFRWKRHARHHGPADLRHDLGSWPHYSRAVVLISQDFRYFGANGTDDYKFRFPRIKHAVEGLGRGHSSNHDVQLRADLMSLKRQVWARYRRKNVGYQTTTGRCRTSHRGRSCGVIA